MNVGDPALWSDVFPEQLIPEILDLVWDTWGTLPLPKPDEFEVPLTRRFKVALRSQKNFRKLPLRIERESPEDDQTNAAELGRIDLKFTPAGSANEDVYFAFECKRLYPIEKGKRKARASEYVTEGMLRFAGGQYASIMRHGGMIGYVLNGKCDAAIAAVEANFSANQAVLFMKAPARFSPSSLRTNNPNIRETTHDLPARAGFLLYHMFLAGPLDETTMTVNDVFTERKRIAEAVLGQTLDAIQKQLDQRGKAGRSQAKDNALFAPISTAVIEAYKAGEIQLAIWLSEAAYKKAKDYEAKTGGEIHKGAITFDLALMYLQIDDFTAAMRYFEIAEAETRATETAEDPSKTPSTFALLRFDLFEKNFWDRIDREAKRSPVMGYKELWGVNYDKTTAKADWDKLSDNSKLLYVITVAQRMRYRRLAEEATWNRANSLHLAHWNLTADLARIIETELKPRKQCPPESQANTLGAVLVQCFEHTTKPSNLSQRQINLHSKHAAKDTATINAAFPNIRKEIEQGEKWEDRIASAVYLLRANRNQVAHSVDDSMVLFTDPEAAKFTVDVLLSLCRVGGWTS